MIDSNFDPDKFKKRISDNIDKADRLHRKFTRQANQLGYIRDSLIEIEPYWRGLADSAIGGSAAINTLDSGSQFMNGLGEGLDNIQMITSNLDQTFSTITTSTDTAFSSTATMSTIVPVKNVNKVDYKPCPFLKQKDHEYYAHRLEKLDPQLAKTYRQTWEALHGTRAEPEHTALFQIRQTYDHFFGILAPDEEVRKSKFWSKKEGEKSKQVYRRERIEYAAHTHVKDKTTATLICANATAILDAYERLNIAHKRDKLNPKDAREAITSIDKILKEWINALDI